MAQSKSTKRVKPVKKEKKPTTPVQEALQITWLLNGHIKRAQQAYILVGVELAEVRDKKLYEALHHPDMEDYAKQRLHLGRSSLYSYLQVHDWIAKCHKEWLEPRPKGYIPDLAHAADLMAIEGELATPGLNPKKRAELDAMRQLGLDGKLEPGAFDRWQKRGRMPEAESLKSYLSALQHLRTRGARLSAMPPEVVSHLDAAIETLKNHQTLQVAGLYFPETGPEKLWTLNSLA